MYMFAYFDIWIVIGTSWSETADSEVKKKKKYYSLSAVWVIIVNDRISNSNETVASFWFRASGSFNFIQNKAAQRQSHSSSEGWSKILLWPFGILLAPSNSF